MKKIEPFKNPNDAISILDNGGRFYNILTRADDGIISKAELGKVGGLFNDQQQMILFLELSLAQLDKTQKAEVLSKLDENLKETYLKYKPQEFLPSQVQSTGIKAENTIITGIPKLTESKNDFNGFIMVPIMTGSVTTFTMIPIMDRYDVYEIRDQESDITFLIAHIKGSQKLPENRVKIAGVLKELKDDKNQEIAEKLFLESVYYIDL
ncbi:hypothetical protein LY01_01097 [Nonlabens xylanidelens]|uniref:Uncharacterized protein n=1 Tax=Nonlabens xylanidelens TaxID=191564 RepID=A0A2S6IMS4_9FLAO|nr:hypothetical protein [Nonlabens xylanidelens]PPK95509.1 hypothetical protein LY01_01097 [Nonlabens xylanidelens]PQJ22321.1 hypothetical protein BST94_01740 [Nonlabens xylanidelens]